jgi:hypothetical protein
VRSEANLKALIKKRDDHTMLPLPDYVASFAGLITLDIMKKRTMPLLPLVLAMSIAPVLAQEAPLGSYIRNATWAQHSDMYKQSPLCGKEEISLWSCESGKRVYSLCSSQIVSRSLGYIQYRASSRGKVVLTYPTEKKPPLGLFVYDSFWNGDASIEFTSNGHKYSLFDSLREGSRINISVPAPSEKQIKINCGVNQTLQVNYTMRLMLDSGVWVAK